MRTHPVEYTEGFPAYSPRLVLCLCAVASYTVYSSPELALIHITQIHTREHTHANKTYIMYIYIYIYILSPHTYLPIVHTLPPCRCAIYDRSPCNPVFGRANVTVPSRYATRTVSTAFTAEDHILTGLSNLFSELLNCLNYLLFLRCLRGCSAAYSPCPGSAWCGANSRHELKRAVMTACRHNRVNSRVVNLNGISVTLSIALIQLLTDPFPNYCICMLGILPLGPYYDTRDYVIMISPPHPPHTRPQFSHSDSAAWGNLALMCALHTVHLIIEY